jgi:hypothetical protein
MVVGEAAATATGARAAAAASREAAFLKNATPAQRRQFNLDKDAQQAEHNVRNLNTQFQVMSRRVQQAEHLIGNWSQHLVANLNLANAVIAHMAAPVRELVGLHNPAKVAQFDLAMKDAQAVVGRELVVVMDAFTRSARKVGDTLAGFEPVMEPAMKSVADMVDAIGNSLSQVMKDCAPEIRALADTIRDLADAATVAAAAVPGATTGLYGAKSKEEREGFWAGFRGGMMGPPSSSGKFNEKATSVGASAQEARFVDAKSISNEAIKNAMMVGAGQKTAEQSLADINRQLGDFFGWAKGQGSGDVAKGGENDGSWFQQAWGGMWRRSMTQQ